MLRRAVHVAAGCRLGPPAIAPATVRLLRARASSAAVAWNGGLTGPTSSDQHYAKTLDLQQAAQLVTERGVLWQAAEADVKAAGCDQSAEAYLQRVKKSAREFFRRNELQGREAVVSTLREVLTGEGQLVMALGGMSVGKSFIMEKLKQEMNEEAARKEQLGRVRSAGGSGRGGALLHEVVGELRTEDVPIKPRRVVIYDARLEGADLVAGLLKAFSRDTIFLERLAQAAAHVIGGIGGAVAAAAAAAIASPASTAAVEPVSAVAAEANRNALLELFSKRPTPLADVVELFIKTCEQEGVYPCLIVDEANRALVAADNLQQQRTVDVLHLLTAYTKQRRSINVMFASSEYSEPYRLSALGFSSDHFSGNVLVSEVPPKEMRELLQGKWGMGPNLATAFMAVWGGHIWAAVTGVELLAAKKASFAADENSVAFSDDAVRGALFCVQAEGTVGMAGMDGMRELLRGVAVRGFVPFEREVDARIKLICERNVGGVVMKSFRAPGLPLEAWDTAPQRMLVVATSQAMRMLLASTLHAAGSR